jgi:dihydroorotate dehydrogenase (NAD+) catalytic subunit
MIELAPNNPYGLALHSPVLLAAGCCGYGAEYARALDMAQFGAIITRTTTLEPRRAAQRPRLIETHAGLLAVGPWPNPGLRYVLERHAPTWTTWDTPVILSVASNRANEYARIVAHLEGVEGIAGVELSVSSELAVAATQAARAATQLPLLVKLPPLDGTPLAELAHAVANAGADALTIAAPPTGMSVDSASGEQLTGWLCGPAVLPLALQRLVAVAGVVNVPVIACGGIANVEHARQCMALGAVAVQVGSALLADPFGVARMASELAQQATTRRA